jgi:hypothetical protein
MSAAAGLVKGWPDFGRLENNGGIRLILVGWPHI